MVRATVAHARILSIDTRDAAALPGVAAVVTAETLGIPAPRIPVRISPQRERLEPYLQAVLASEVVRYVGEPVAVVVAEDPYLAEDAAELVAVDYDELPVVLDARHAGEGAGVLFDSMPNEVTCVDAAFGDEATRARALALATAHAAPFEGLWSLGPVPPDAAAWRPPDAAKRTSP
jgi:carbon-monoxide dehydrogenase large subunit/6-hydroxypseudooxynicotine dehydrogenase subunit gamma